MPSVVSCTYTLIDETRIDVTGVSEEEDELSWGDIPAQPVQSTCLHITGN